jgi:hypothetical protein
MRHKIVTIAAAGVLGVSGFALAGPALAATGATDTAAAVSSRVDRITSALSGLVKDGTITQDQADKVAGALDSADLGGGHHGGFGGRGGHGGEHFAAAAKALGVTEAELRTALGTDKSLADVAKDKNVSVDTVIAALVDSEKAELAAAVKAGRLTQVQADSRTTDLTARITERVNTARPARPEGDRRHGGRGGPDDDRDDTSTATPTPSSTS